MEVKAKSYISGLFFGRLRNSFPMITLATFHLTLYYRGYVF